MRYKISLAPAVPHHARSGLVRMFSATIDDPMAKSRAAPARDGAVPSAGSHQDRAADLLPRRSRPCALRSGFASAVLRQAGGADV
jgi:hypothetical protein